MLEKVFIHVLLSWVETELSVSFVAKDNVGGFCWLMFDQMVPTFICFSRMSFQGLHILFHGVLLSILTFFEALGKF